MRIPNQRAATAGSAGGGRNRNGSKPSSKVIMAREASRTFEDLNRGAWKECLALLPPGPDAVHTLPPPRRSDGSNASAAVSQSAE